MTVDAWISVFVLLLVLGTLVCTRYPPDAVIIGGVTLLITFGVLDPRDLLVGFSNEAIATLAVLYVVAAAFRETGLVRWGVERVLGRHEGAPDGFVPTRMMWVVALLSAFLNNTPIVATLIPGVKDWCRRNKIPPSRLMIPLSYAAILGGRCTLIGTSTNLVVSGLLIEAGHEGLAFFSPAWVGLPGVVLGVLYVAATGRRLLPDRAAGFADLADLREYAVEMVVEEQGGVRGKSIEQAGLRHLPGLYLTELCRGDQVIPAVAPDQMLEAGDQLLFVGAVDSVVDLQKIRGLRPATEQVSKIKGPRHQRSLMEVAVSDSYPLLGKTIREGRFRGVYNAVVVAVSRRGKRIPGKIGDIELCPGDLLLLEGFPWSLDALKRSTDFYLASDVEDSRPPHHSRAWVAGATLVALVVASAAGWLTLLHAALLAAGVMLIARCCTATQARQSVDWQVLIVIGGSFALGKALEVTGAASTAAESLLTRLRVLLSWWHFPTVPRWASVRRSQTTRLPY